MTAQRTTELRKLLPRCLPSIHPACVMTLISSTSAKPLVMHSPPGSSRRLMQQSAHTVNASYSCCVRVVVLQLLPCSPQWCRTSGSWKTELQYAGMMWSGEAAKKTKQKGNADKKPQKLLCDGSTGHNMLQSSRISKQHSVVEMGRILGRVMFKE